MAAAAFIDWSDSSVWLLLLPTLHVLAVLAGVAHVLMQKPKVGIAFAWIILIITFPVAGITLYLLVGERRISLRRRKKLEQARQHAPLKPAQSRRRHPLPAASPDPHALISLLQAGTCGPPTVASNIQLHANTHDVLRQLATEIDQAQTSIWMAFYIWHPGGDADAVLAALERAAGRGVQCHLLLDDIGSANWWKSGQPERLRRAGASVRRALPTGLFRALVGRTDLRLHRKIVVLDERIAWTGSMNLVDPRHFKQDEGVGEWVDAMARIEGKAVLSLLAIVIGDWRLESRRDPVHAPPLATTEKYNAEPGNGRHLQVMASGPGQSGDELLLLLLELLYSARRELVVTTPYFVPDDALVLALRSAALRGVRVIVLAPEKNDSLLVRYAAESYYAELLQAGVEIRLFRGGLLHTKSITVDGQLSLFGTVNLDMRSIWINYEVSLVVYDAPFTQQLRHLQQSYLEQARRLDRAEWRQIPFQRRLLQNGMRLLAPLL
ncbi:cardiolipin synthase [Candidatus Thiothrix sp. Deng01]|uniref:Cardiolipin synthase n=1 Tax=Candidatus Thiothrix phosphatis TaxID=3112415 RepID=A0ABU6D1E6_9GAMM|nr:cardiolipin synthase [Candidatus Thiothrix sp. Deng01]MEB4592900.1 cardiolipin synthase [Candidatus Thiothrix sp. Deng01]